MRELFNRANSGGWNCPINSRISRWVFPFAITRGDILHAQTSVTFRTFSKKKTKKKRKKNTQERVSLMIYIVDAQRAHSRNFDKNKHPESRCCWLGKKFCSRKLASQHFPVTVSIYRRFLSRVQQLLFARAKESERNFSLIFACVISRDVRGSFLIARVYIIYIRPERRRHSRSLLLESFTQLSTKSPSG